LSKIEKKQDRLNERFVTLIKVYTLAEKEFIPIQNHLNEQHCVLDSDKIFLLTGNLFWLK